MRTTTVILSRDCEGTIERALASAALLTDDVLVIDTGSVDGTPELVEATPGATLHRTDWQDSFASARNLAFDLVSDGLLIFLDSDEWIDADEAREKRSLLRHLTAHDVVWSPVVHDVSGHSAAHHLPRIINVENPCRFRYRIHERLAHGDEEAWPQEIALTVHHDGYTDEHKARFDKLARNLRLLRMELAEHPDDPHVLFFWLRDGLETRTPEENRAIIEELDDQASTRTSTRNDNFRVLARKVFLDHEWRRVGAEPATVAIAEELINFAPDDADAHYVLGVAELINAHRQVRSSLGRLAGVRSRMGEAPLQWSMTTRPVHLDALIGEQLRTLGDPRHEAFLGDLSRTWTDPYFDHSLRRGLG